MKKIISIKDLDIVQKNFQQMVIRGNGKDDFNQIVNKEISILPPAKNLEIVVVAVWDIKPCPEKLIKNIEINKKVIDEIFEKKKHENDRSKVTK